jgi:hypothetical protein
MVEITARESMYVHPEWHVPYFSRRETKTRSICQNNYIKEVSGLKLLLVIF